MKNKNLLDKIYQIGVKEKHSEYLNSRIILCNKYNFITILVVVAASMVIFFTTPSLMWLIFLSFVIIFSTYFLNYFGQIYLSRFITSLAGVIITSIISGYSNPSHIPVLPGAVLLVMSFFVSSFLMFDVREKGYLFFSLFINILVLANYQWFNDFFVMTPEDPNYSDRIADTVLILMAAANFTSSIFLIQQLNYKSEKRTEQLINNVNIQNKVLKDKELALNKSILEIKKAQEEDIKRNWASEGFAKAAIIMRNASNDLGTMSENILRYLIQYVGANQGGLFILNDTNPTDLHLELTAAYAYERKKYLTKRIDIGENLVGQCFLEKDIIFLTDLPQDYINITSGLGQATPTCVLICPLIINENVNGVLEIAFFNVIEPYKIEFIKKTAENIAATISTVKTNDNIQKLLTISQQQTEQMRAQEEELRQNMEEMQATQEEMLRKQIENQ